jgi:DNA invertase Pin-like site-specific DNA recombinase
MRAHVDRKSPPVSDEESRYERARAATLARVRRGTAARAAARAAKAAGRAPTPPPRTIGYVRVSSDAQAEQGQSLEVQRQQLQAWAAMCGRTIDTIIVEPGVSAASVEFRKRPEASKLWTELQRGDTLVSTKLDRCFRNTRDCLNAVHEMKKRGVSFRLLELGGGMDELTMNGFAAFFLQVMAAVAEFESARTGERIRGSKQRQRAMGLYSGGARKFGWTHDPKTRKLTEVPEEQAAIRRIHKLADRGFSPYKISADLAELGLKLSHVSIRKIVNRARADDE